MNRRGPRTSDVRRAKAAFLEASRVLDEHPTPKEIKALSRLAKAAARTEREAFRRQPARRPRPKGPAPKDGGSPSVSLATEFRDRLAELACVKGRAHFNAERALRRDPEAAVARAGAGVRPGGSLESLVWVLVAAEILAPTP